MYQRILACVDFSKSAAKVMQKAKQIAAENQAELVLMHVVEYLPPLEMSGDPMSLPNWVMDENEILENAKHSMQRMAEEQGCSDVEQVVVNGMPKMEIHRVLEERNIDLLVIGSHGRHGLGRLLGSTANALLNNASCDVLAVRLND